MQHGTIRLTVHRTDSPRPSKTPALQIALVEDINAGLTEYTKRLDISRLSKGTYRLELRLEDASGKSLVKQESTMVVQ